MKSLYYWTLELIVLNILMWKENILQIKILKKSKNVQMWDIKNI